jgi:hypothetical protein
VEQQMPRWTFDNIPSSTAAFRGAIDFDDLNFDKRPST